MSAPANDDRFAVRRELQSQTAPASDSDLLEVWVVATQQGHAEAFGRVYDNTASDINAWFLARCFSPHTSADLTAETFATALANLESFKPGRGPVRAWLFGLARNLWRRFCRSGNVDQRARLRLGLPTAITEDFADEICERSDALALSNRLNTAWDTLSPTVAAAVTLRVIQGLHFDEVAARLNIGAAAARKRVARGLAILADQLEHPEEGTTNPEDLSAPSDQQGDKS